MFQKRSNAIVASAVIGAAVFWMAGRLKAFNPQPDPPALGAFQLLTSESAMLFAHCSAQSTNFGLGPGACEVSMLFRDANGVILKQTNPALVLRPGQTAVLELSNGGGVTRNPPIVVVPEINTAATGGHIVPSLQVVDINTGLPNIYSVPASPKLSWLGN